MSDQLRIERMAHVMGRCGLSRSGIAQRVKEGRFPQPIPLGKAVGFLGHEIDEWIETQIRAVRPQLTDAGAPHD